MSEAEAKMIEVLSVDQFYESRFEGKDYASIPEIVRKEKPYDSVIARKILVGETWRPGFASCWMRPDANGLCEIIKENWDTSD